MNLVKYRNLFFGFSLLIIIPGAIALFLWGLKVGIDFAGGTLWEVKIAQSADAPWIREFLVKEGAEVSQVAQTAQDTYLVRLKTTEEETLNNLRTKVDDNFGPSEDVRLETVGPTISKELAQKAIIAVLLAIAGIVVYLTWSFRQIPKPASSLAFGVCTVIALLHDVLVLVGVFAILGHFFAIEVDALFITATLTVIGFSVHDTIVVFDRIRENLKKYDDYPFENVVNHSILQTFSRSLNTSLTAVFVLLALFLFGGETIKTFVLALLIGIISGTYSSIFNAAPLLILWQNFKGIKFRLKRN
ncbi:protein-export membrane protein SecF [Candidatus Curtissbacteria bacterium RIFCSPHIGHO2_02_FULL_42_15]|uniref:Protein-export membrane protein SecF n=1 Tax=Candidatus Curtissbacteria bacterium RIFCSPHIGHO2_02_FULL_42_15 TaxID=1797716 RepID=A0A1F5GIN1_9BACT|nr:MAG: protein-export membrane protein SecF [Candidatus Curtissbacteria bacterium RIFCSPHIGHO2_02_FULL_42_15]